MARPRAIVLSARLPSHYQVNPRQVSAGVDLSFRKLVVTSSSLRVVECQCALPRQAPRQTSGLDVPARADYGSERTAGLRVRLRLRRHLERANTSAFPSSATYQDGWSLELQICVSTYLQREGIALHSGLPT